MLVIVASLREKEPEQEQASTKIGLGVRIMVLLVAATRYSEMMICFLVEWISFLQM